MNGPVCAMIAYEVNVLEELRRAGITWTYGAVNAEVNIICPFHEETVPSLGINTEKKVFKCRGCQAKGDFATFISRLTGVERHVVVIDWAKRYGLKEDKTVEPSLVEKYHEQIWKAGPILLELRKRGVSDEAIRLHRLGESKGRVTIPIKNRLGQFVNIQKYQPGATAGSKFTNLRGRGKMRLYPIEQLDFPSIVITGGPIKAIVGAEVLNAHNIGCISATGGEGNWDDSFNSELQGKHVWVCLDIDAAGRNAANMLCARIYASVASDFRIDLPLDPDTWPRGGLDDFVASGGDLLQALDNAVRYEPRKRTDDADSPAEDVLLAAAAHPANVGKRLKVRALASCVDEQIFLVPKSVKVLCGRDQPACGVCPVVSLGLEPIMNIGAESEALLEMTNASRKVQREAVRQALAIPVCKTVVFETEENHAITEAVIVEDVNVSNTVTEKTELHIACVDSKIELGESYNMEGRVVPHPRTQAATFVVSKSESAASDLSSFKVDDDVRDQLRTFQPKGWTLLDIEDQLDRLYADFERFTRIYERRDMHLLVDLAYHSPLWIRARGRNIKGWVEVLIVGDSAQGKTETAENIAKHYGLGEKMDCKNASVAGIIGGMQKVGDRWFATWGVLPTQDRRLVIFEESKGMRKEVFAKLTEVRSSGRADIPKIKRSKAWARVRLVMLSNPRTDGHVVSSYSYGIDVIRELIGGLEDIRRFDACMVVGQDEVSKDIISSDPVIEGEQIFTSDVCRKLVLWAWTRTSEDVVLDDVWESVLETAGRLNDEFTDSVPIVDKGSMKSKIARLASALACRTFSTDDGERVIVRKCHVQFIEKYLRRIYKAQPFGYDRFTQAVRAADELRDPQRLVREIANLKHKDDFIDSILNASMIDEQDFCDWNAWGRDEARTLMSLLVRHNALKREGRNTYRKTPRFIELLKGMVVKEHSARPQHVELEEW